MVISHIHSAVSVTASLIAVAQSVNPGISAKLQTHQQIMKRFLRSPQSFSGEGSLVQALAGSDETLAQEARAAIHRTFAGNAGYVLANLEGVLAVLESSDFDKSHLSKMTSSQTGRICIIANQLRLARQMLVDYIWDLSPAYLDNTLS